MSQEVPPRNTQEQPRPPLKTDVYREDLMRLVRVGGYSREEYFRAHELALGVPETETESQGEVSERVRDLAEKIKALLDAGMPATVSAGIADALFELESAPEHLRTLIGTLHLSDQEKQTLHSIFDKQRIGELTVYTQGSTAPVFTLTVPADVWESAHTPERLAVELGGALYRLKDERLELTWSE